MITPVEESFDNRQNQTMIMQGAGNRRWCLCPVGGQVDAPCPPWIPTEERLSFPKEPEVFFPVDILPTLWQYTDYQKLEGSPHCGGKIHLRHTLKLRCDPPPTTHHSKPNPAAGGSAGGDNNSPVSELRERCQEYHDSFVYFGL